LKAVGAGRDSNMFCITMLDSCCLKYRAAERYIALPGHMTGDLG
jgi:hypothetical protein